MNVLVDCPQSSAGEWRFRLFGTDVRVKFWFWISVALLCGYGNTGGVLIWVAVCLASVLIHEFGHVAALRFYHERSDVVLYGWGGLTIPHHSVRATLPRFVVALAGPTAGFCVTLITMAAASLAGTAVHVRWHLIFPVLAAAPADFTSAFRGTNQLWYDLINSLLWVNFYWGLVNLLPVYPLDGGHAAMAILEQRDPYRGRRNAWILSAVAAGGMAALGAVEGSLYLLLPFVVLAASSLQALESERGRRPRPYERWRG